MADTEFAEDRSYSSDYSDDDEMGMSLDTSSDDINSLPGMSDTENEVLLDVSSDISVRDIDPPSENSVTEDEQEEIHTISDAESVSNEIQMSMDSQSEHSVDDVDPPSEISYPDEESHEQQENQTISDVESIPEENEFDARVEWPSMQDQLWEESLADDVNNNSSSSSAAEEEEQTPMESHATLTPIPIGDTSIGIRINSRVTVRERSREPRLDILRHPNFRSAVYPQFSDRVQRFNLNDRTPVPTRFRTLDVNTISSSSSDEENLLHGPVLHGPVLHGPTWYSQNYGHFSPERSRAIPSPPPPSTLPFRIKINRSASTVCGSESPSIISCPICFQNIRSRSPCSLKCGHLTCGICLNQLLEHDLLTCPVCRMEFITSDVRQIYPS